MIQNAIRVICLSLLGCCISLAQAPVFKISYNYPDPAPRFTPRVYILLTKGLIEPANHITNWFNLPIILAADDFDKDGKVTIDRNALTNTPLAEVEGDYNAQAIVRINPNWPFPGMGEGDLRSEPLKISIKKDAPATYDFNADRVTPAPDFRKSGRIQDHYFHSKKLSAFHKRDYNMRYSIILPEGWDAEKKHPVILYVEGFGMAHQNSTHHVDQMIASRCKDAIVVIADANCRWGHSVFADSATNGPWGNALITELLPHIDKTYGGAGAEHRYVTGVSSGGWTSLWLIINYPEAFQACWAVAPDPVDFSHFQQINLLSEKPENLFTNGQKDERLLSIDRLGLTYRQFAEYEKVLGPGGQLKSFAAVFSPLDKSSQPRLWYDEESGAIDQIVTDRWEHYDISRSLRKNWKQLNPRIRGKINVLVHEEDLFLLNFSVKQLEKTCKQLGSDANFVYLKGKGHHIPLTSAEKMIASIEVYWESRKP